MQWKYTRQYIIYSDFLSFLFYFSEFHPNQSDNATEIHAVTENESEKDLVKRKDNKNDEGRQKTSIDVSVLTGK